MQLKKQKRREAEEYAKEYAERMKREGGTEWPQFTPRRRVRDNIIFHAPTLQGTSYRNPLSPTHAGRCTLNGNIRAEETYEGHNHGHGDRPCYCRAHSKKINYYVQCLDHGVWIECPFSAVRDHLNKCCAGEGEGASTTPLDEDAAALYKRVVEFEAERERELDRVASRYGPRASA